MTTAIDELLERFQALPEEKQKLLIEQALAAKEMRAWTPLPGSQSDAYFSEADITLYAGGMGNGKTQLLVGLALNEHHNSLILRRQKTEAKKLIGAFQAAIGSTQGLNRGDLRWHYDGRTIEFGGCDQEDDKQKYKGLPHDLIGFDEIVDFTQSQFEFIIQWNRNTIPDQRCRVVCTCNPPTRDEGLWIFEYWSPWFPFLHDNPAKAGELRWFTNVDGKDTEVDGPGPHLIGGESIMARSRTAIFGDLGENPYLPNYDATRAAAPSGLRDLYRDAKFDRSLADSPDQLIPSQWVRAAMGRWEKKPPVDTGMDVLGVDCSGGGRDPMIIAPRYAGWFAPLIEVKAESLGADSMGSDAAGHVIRHRRHNATVIVDMGGGFGFAVYERLNDNGVLVVPHKGQSMTNRRTIDKQLGFTNLRSACYWAFREALDPDQEGGSPIQLPNDNKLYAELTTPTFSVQTRGIQVEQKEKVIQRLGRSPDRADAVVMAWSGGHSLYREGRTWERKDNWVPPRVNRW